MKIKHLKFWVIVIVLLSSSWMTVPALAHAILLRSNPVSNAVLTSPPVQVELFFSEPLEASLSSISVLNSNGVIMDAGDVRVDPSDATRMTVSLRSLSDGVYTVTWRAVSALDGHQTVGSYPFAVGNANAEAVKATRQTSSARLPFSSLFAKVIMLASLAILAGQRLFIALVWEPELNLTT